MLLLLFFVADVVVVVVVVAVVVVVVAVAVVVEKEQLLWLEWLLRCWSGCRRPVVVRVVARATVAVGVVISRL